MASLVTGRHHHLDQIGRHKSLHEVRCRRHCALAVSTGGRLAISGAPLELPAAIKLIAEAVYRAAPGWRRFRV
jgi:hypothetical protein